MTNYYLNDMDYLRDELRRLDLLLDLRLQRMKAEGHTNHHLFRDLNPPEAKRKFLTIPRLNHKNVEEMEADIKKKVHLSLESGIEPSLYRITRIFNLNKVEVLALLTCLAAELDPKYEKIFSDLQESLTTVQPTPGIILDLLFNSLEDRLTARRFFLPDSPLFKHKLLEAQGKWDSIFGLSSPLKISPDVLKCILGTSPTSSRRLTGDRKPSNYNLHENIPAGDRASDEQCYDASLPENIVHLAQNLARSINLEDGTLYYLQGPYGSGRKALAKLVSRKMGLGLVETNLSTLIFGEESAHLDAISRTFRNALLEGSAAYIEGLDVLSSEDSRILQAKAEISKALQEFTGLAFLVGQENVDLGPEIQGRILTVKIPVSDYPERRRIWEGILRYSLSQADIDDLASKFKFTSGQIADAAGLARRIAALEGRVVFEKDDLYKGCRTISNRKLSSLAKRVEPDRRWIDLVLPENKVVELKEIVSHVRHRNTVYNIWGFEKKLSLGKGVNILFSGSSGTGKTLAAEVLATELGLELYKIDLSSVVSKYIGDTEKNLNKIFQESTENNSILFFDEADALFGKRSEVKDAQDRHANIEVGYLLQKIEEHQGIVIMATNLAKNMDYAFLRRIHFSVEFPFPNEDLRIRIWNALLPKTAPLSKEVDFGFLARNFKIAGGSIKNALVSAAFIAAEESKDISMEHLVKAVWNECRKVGLYCTKEDLEEYACLVDTNRE